jgi:urease accessory protein
MVIRSIFFPPNSCAIQIKKYDNKKNRHTDTNNPFYIGLFMNRTLLFSAAFLAASTSLASAHPGHTLFTDMSAGLLHPLSGFDHILAMFAVGLLAVQNGGASKLFLPLTFVAAMAVGGLVGVSSFEMPYMELGIAGSIVFLGVVIASGKNLTKMTSTVMVALFAIVHGMAHGTEIPADTSILAFGIGMLFATGSLHIAGVLFGKIAPTMLRTSGALIAASGLALAAV